MRILILSIYHDPEPIPKTGELARALRERGHEVTVVTAFPHYPSGKLYPGYTLRPWRWETRQGVRTLRTFIFPYHGKSAALRMVNYASWMISSIQCAWLAPACDVIYVWHPPLTVGVSAWLIGKLKRAPFVYDVQDLWPESALASGLMHPGALTSFLYGLAAWVYARANRILVVSRQAADYLIGRGAPAGRVQVAPHWLDTAVFDKPRTGDVREEMRLGNQFVAMFAGNLGFVQGLDTVLDAAAILREHSHIEWLLVGDGADRPRLERRVAAEGLTNVRFLGAHPASKMPALLGAADVLVAHLQGAGVAGHAVPTKLLSYLAACRPIVCGATGAAAELVQRSGAGVATPPGDAAALAAAVADLETLPASTRLKMGNAGRAYLNAHFLKERVIDLYEDILRDVAAGSVGRAPAAGPRA